MAQIDNNPKKEQPYIPIKVIRFILEHRRNRLAAKAEKETAFESVKSE